MVDFWSLVSRTNRREEPATVDPSSQFPPAAWAAAGLLAACVARPLHPWIRGLLNPALEHHVRAQLPAVVAAQRAADALERAAPPLGAALRSLIALSAATVTVEFYIAVLPLMIWGGGAVTLAGLKLVGLLATSGYAAYALKDLLASPRPGEEAARVLLLVAGGVDNDDGGPVVSPSPAPHSTTTTPQRRSSRLAARHAEMVLQEAAAPNNSGGDVAAAARALRVRDHSKDVEDGAPSSHVSLSLPMTLHALALLWPVVVMAGGAGAEELLPPKALVLAALAWVVFVGWSRLYLGVHTPVDLFTGAALGHLSLAAWKGPVEEAWLRWAMTTRTATAATTTAVPLVAVAAALFAMRMHPVPTRPTACFNYSTAFVGAGLGVTLGVWAFAPRLLRVFASGGGGEAATTTTTGLSFFLLKAAVGLAAVLGTRAAVKALLLTALPPVMDLAPSSLRALWQPPPADAALVVEAKQTKGKRRAGGKNQALGSFPPRRADNGVPYDVDAAARLGSYTAAVFVVVAHAALWPAVVVAGLAGVGGGR